MTDVKAQWQTAAPLWEEALKDAGGVKKRFYRPAILRFAADTFMEDLQAILKTKSTDLTGTVVRYETWESEAAGWLALDEEAAEKTPLRLYHPAHGRFYLVAASLACRKPGLPDRPLDTGKKETVSFVMRRLATEDGKEVEYGWMGNYGWQKVESPLTVPVGEERFPLFAMYFKDRDRQRRLLAGLIPVASKETFQAPAKLNPYILSEEERQTLLTGDDPFADPRAVRFDTMVLGAAEELMARAAKPGADQMTDPEAREILMWICLDFAEFLQEHLPGVGAAVDGGLSTWPGPAGDDKNLFNRLHSTTFTGAYKWDAVLDSVYAKRNDIISGAVEDPSGSIAAFTNLTAADVNNAIAAILPGGPLATLVTAALGEYKGDAAGNGNGAGVPGVPRYAGGFYYVIRCVYERPQCKGIHSPVVSEPSRAFQLASFFEPDAPARPVNITLPENTGIAGLRKFKKNVSVLISKNLRNQMERMTGLKLGDLDEGNIPGEKDPGFNLGMICSFSIPIITICALLLLMIIVQLLNIVFWWLPFFKICFPKKS